MGTWISHLRVAAKILENTPWLEEVGFYYGNLAPDSGLPNQDWTVFDPPKSVTHFLGSGNREEDVQDLIFYARYLAQRDDRSNSSESSFLWGYYCHLVTDLLWAKRIGTTTRSSNQALFSSHSMQDAVEKVKSDWYGLDFKFLRDHPKNSFWQGFMNSNIPTIPLPFIPQAAFDHQMRYIKEYYSTPDESRILDRSFPYLNEKTLDEFICTTSATLLTLMIVLKEDQQAASFSNASQILPPEHFSALGAPLGDELKNP